MKKTLLSIAAIASIVSVASADETWFNGNIGGTASGGSWDENVEGVTLDQSKYALEDVEAFKFTATESKSVSGSENLNFTSSIKFQYAYDELPAIGATDKAGVIAFGEENPTYYVLAKDAVGGTNMWVDTELTATPLADAVAVNVVISNGNDSVWAIYKIGNNNPIAKEIVVGSSSSFQIAQYSGSGEINTLIGQLIALGYPIPGNKTIATDAAEAWAKAMGYTKEELAAMLSSSTVYAGNRTAAESCILGVNTNDEINASIDDAGVAANKLKFTVQLEKIISGHDVKFQLKKGAAVLDDAQTALVFNPDLADGEYSIVAYIDGANKEIPVSKTMGVKTVASTFASSASAGFLAVPYTGVDGGIAIANLFKKALLVEGDQLDIFDSATAGWKTFKFEGGAWKGIVKNDVTPDPATTTIKRGQAFKLTRPEAVGMSAPVYLGYVATAAAKVSLPSKKYELVADPAGSTVSVSKLGDSDWAAKVDVDAKTPNVMYKKIGSEWKKIEYVGGKATATTVEAIDGAFFFLNRGAEAKELDFSK